jgi:hypothetical protein
MARHLIIGDGTTFGVTNGLVDDGAISVQKMTESGPTELALGDSFADAPQIRIVGGGKDGKNIVTPWIYGRDVINWGGNSYTAPTAHQQTATYTGTSTAAGSIDIKFVRTDGPTPEFFKFSTAIASGVANTAADVLVQTAYAAANLPDWLALTCTAPGNSNVFTGVVRGGVAQSGNTWEYGPVTFEVVVTGMPAGLTAAVSGFGAANTADANPGYGEGFAIRAFEESLQGTSHGFYMRGHLPKQPSLESVTGTNYDMYNITATKDGSSNSQIHGVDNLIEINIAAVAGDADSLVVENKLNAYFTGHFPAVIL